MTDEITELRGRLEAAERELEELREAEQPEPEPPERRDPEREFAERVRDHMNRSLTPWYGAGGGDAA
jgi:hypothetical protein